MAPLLLVCQMIFCYGTGLSAHFPSLNLKVASLGTKIEAKKRLEKVLIKKERERERDRRPFSYIKKAQSSHIVIVSLTGTNIQQFQWFGRFLLIRVGYHVYQSLYNLFFWGVCQIVDLLLFWTKNNKNILKANVVLSACMKAFCRILELVLPSG